MGEGQLSARTRRRASYRRPVEHSEHQVSARGHGHDSPEAPASLRVLGEDMENIPNSKLLLALRVLIALGFSAALATVVYALVTAGP